MQVRLTAKAVQFAQCQCPLCSISFLKLARSGIGPKPCSGNGRRWQTLTLPSELILGFSRSWTKTAAARH